MKAEDLVRQYRMIPHEENGYYLERHYETKEEGRPASGSIYYYIGPEEVSQFHVIDCGEYWIYSAGSPLEIWQITPDGEVSKSLLGIGLGLEPLAYIPAGNIFAARHLPNAEDGTFVSCITVPRFKYDGWRLVEKAELREKYPQALAFFEK